MHTAPAPALLALARADQVATLYRSWHRTTASMVLGALILCGVLWEQGAAWVMATWIAAILVNQAWRGVLARAYRRARPAVADAPRWGAYWAVGSTLAGALWGVAAVWMYPASPAHQALLIVCLFGVILGGLNLTAVYKPSFYGFVLAALVPLIVRVALEGDQAHLFTALVLGVVLVFVLAFGHQVNDVLTQSLAMRYENVDLIGELQAQTDAALAARAAAETANRAKSQFLAAASHDLRQPLHAVGLFAAALAARARDPDVKPLVASIHASVEALEGLFAQLLDLSRLEAGALRPAPARFRSRRCSPVSPPISRRRRARPASRCASCRRGSPSNRIRCCSSASCATSSPTRSATRAPAGSCSGRAGAAKVVRIDVIDTGVGIGDDDRARVFDEFVQLAAAPRHHAAGRGMGLGLAIVRRLAALLGHRIELASMPGRGSRFSIVVPRAILPRQRAVPPRIRDEPLAGRRAGARRDAASSWSTTIPRWSPRWARCSPRGRRRPPAAPTPTRRSPHSPPSVAAGATASTSSSPISAWPTAVRESTPSRGCAMRSARARPR